MELDGAAEKRRSPRKSVDNMTADISYGHRAFMDCQLADVSIGGMCIKGISSKHAPKEDSLDKAEFTVIVSTGKKKIRMIIIPTWVMSNQRTQEATVGFRIKGEVHPWIAFVREKIKIPSNRADDVWGKWNEKHSREDRFRI